MSRLAFSVSVLALVATIAPPLLFVADRLSLDDTKLWMLVATIAWFASAPLWMDREEA